jgi:hypothetical protein
MATTCVVCALRTRAGGGRRPHAHSGSAVRGAGSVECGTRKKRNPPPGYQCRLRAATRPHLPWAASTTKQRPPVHHQCPSPLPPPCFARCARRPRTQRAHRDFGNCHVGLPGLVVNARPHWLSPRLCPASRSRRADSSPRGCARMEHDDAGEVPGSRHQVCGRPVSYALAPPRACEPESRAPVMRRRVAARRCWWAHTEASLCAAL